MRQSRFARLLLVSVLLAFFTSAIVYSAATVRIPVGSSKLGEVAVTKLSLTHEVQRMPDGKLANPYEESRSNTIVVSSVAGPVMMASSKVQPATKKPAVKKPVVKKPAPKKPVIKKPVPKKPVPKKPAPKKPVPPVNPGAGKACPT